MYSGSYSDYAKDLENFFNRVRETPSYASMMSGWCSSSGTVSIFDEPVKLDLRRCFELNPKLVTCWQ